MANILSQDEVDSLLEGITEGKIQTEADTVESSSQAKAYDFSRPSNLIHLALPTLGIINERFVGLLRTSLPISSKSVVDINLASTESVKFNEFCRSLPMPSSLNIFKMEPLRGFSMIVIEGPLVFSFVDSSFGGKGVSHVKLEGRGFTNIETKIVEKIVKIILQDLQQAWGDVHPIKTIFTRSEMDPQFAGIVTPDDIVIVCKFQVELENGSGAISICIPYSSLEPIKNKLKSRYRGEQIEIDRSWQKYIREKILSTHVEVSCCMGRTQINGRDLLHMKVDDIILLDQRVGDSIVVNVEGLAKFKGLPGSSNKKKAVKISESIN